MGGIVVLKEKNSNWEEHYVGWGFFWFWNLDIFMKWIGEEGYRSFKALTARLIDWLINVSNSQNTMLASHFLLVHLVDLQILLAQKWINSNLSSFFFFFRNNNLWFMAYLIDFIIYRIKFEKIMVVGFVC